jgi:hypothetical protein
LYIQEVISAVDTLVESQPLEAGLPSSDKTNKKGPVNGSEMKLGNIDPIQNLDTDC